MITRSQVKRDFAPEQIIQLVLALGSSDYRHEADLPDSPIVFQTICHNPAHTGSYKLYYYPESQRFHCYTQCGCSFDLYELIMRSKKCSFFEAIRFTQQVLHIDPRQKIGFFTTCDKETTTDLDDWALLNKYAAHRKRESSIAYPPLPATLIDYYTKAHPVEWLQNGISPQALDRFNVRFSIANNEIIIPHYDKDDSLIGIRSRSLNEEKVAAGCKYMPTQMEGTLFKHSLRGNLYGLNVCKDAVARSRKIMICESEKSALQSYSMYGENSFTVAVCGSNISTVQRDMVLTLGVKEVFLAMDKEYKEAYSVQSDQYADKLLHLAGLFTPYVVTYILFDTEGLLDYKDSPTDKGQEVLERLMKTKFEIETNQ